MNALRPGWTLATVDDLGELRLGKMLDSARNRGKPTRYLRNVNVRWFQFDLEDLSTLRVTDEEIEDLSVRDGDLFICEGGEPGRCAVWGGGANQLVFQKALHRFRSAGAILPEFLMYRLSRDAASGQLGTAMTGMTIRHLPKERLSRFEIPVPPLAEQKRIVHKIQTLHERMDRCRQRFERLEALFARIRRNVLVSATNGDLSREWRIARKYSNHLVGFSDGAYSDVFRDFTFPESWSVARLGDAGEITTGITKDSKLQSAAFREIPYLRVANVQRGYLDLSEVKTIRVSPDRVSELLLARGDILFNEGGDLDKLGRSWVWNEEIPECVFQNHILRVRLRDASFEPRFFSWYGNSRGVDYFLSRGKQTTNLASISRSVLSAMPIAIPPAEEQAEIVRRVSSIFRILDAAERVRARAFEQLALVKDLVLDKAVRGLLLPQDAQDEAACLLIERTKSERAQSKSKQRRSRVQGAEMNNDPKDVIKSMIMDAESDSFTFDEVRSRVPGDYEALKEALFELLGDSNPRLRQEFDPLAKVLRFAKVKS